MFPSFRPAFLAFWLLCSVLAAQQLTPASSSGTTVETKSAQETVSSTLNRLQGTRVAEIQIRTRGVEHTEWLKPLLVQGVNEPLDKNKVRLTVQALYDTGRFSQIQVEAQRNDKGGLVLIFDAQ